MTPEECLEKFKDHKWVTRPGGSPQINPFTGKKSVMRVRVCSRCETADIFFEDDPDEESGSKPGDGGNGGNGGGGGTGGCTCMPSAQDPNCPIHGY
jgi:hypothetical protein